jgi:hypothetical protein
MRTTIILLATLLAAGCARRMAPEDARATADALNAFNAGFSASQPQRVIVQPAYPAPPPAPSYRQTYTSCRRDLRGNVSCVTR